MHFIKLHGAGNDYIFIDCFTRSEEYSKENMSSLAIEMSDRHFGVGGDGVVYLFPSEIADVKMRMFNADGSEGAMCGNAVRCIAKLFCERLSSSVVTVETQSGIKTVTKSNGLFTVDMGLPQITAESSIDIDGERVKYTCVSVGNPHCVIFTSDLGDRCVRVAEVIQSRMFPGGVNVEFASLSQDGLNVRVFERGSGETLSCGTGACAAVAAGVYGGLVKANSDVAVTLKGGILWVNYSGNIFLTGNAEKVYEGDYYDKVHFCNGRRSQRSG